MRWIVESFDFGFLEKVAVVLRQAGIHTEIRDVESRPCPCKAIFVREQEFDRAMQVITALEKSEGWIDR